MKKFALKKSVWTSVLAVALAVMCAFALSACGSSSNSSSSTSGSSNNVESSKTVKIGIRSDMVDQLASVQSKIEALGYKVESTVFDDSVAPDNALKEGSIDVNWYQHEPYMQAFNKSNGTNFVMVTPKTFYPLFAMYSTKYTSLSELPDGATIGLCSDSTNKARGLKMLEDQGLIKLKSGVESPTQFDIEENSKNLQFTEAEMSVLPQSEDDVDAICLAAGHMVNAGKSAEGYLCQSSDNETYAVGFVVKDQETANQQWVKDIAKAVQCDELAKYFKEKKAGTQIPTWE